MNLTLQAGLLDELVQYFRAELPREGCGILTGDANGAARFIPITNRLASESAFEMEPVELIEAFRNMRLAGERLIAICHSHPNGPAIPSSRDIADAAYPEAAHVIVSLASTQEPAVRAFRIVMGEVIDLELHVIV